MAATFMSSLRLFSIWVTELESMEKVYISESWAVTSRSLGLHSHTQGRHEALRLMWGLTFIRIFTLSYL